MQKPSSEPVGSQRYQQTIDWMFKQLPMYQNVGASAYKNDLSNTIKLAAALGNPEKKLRCIHVGGTNGKGSTSNMLASVLQEAGYKVGLYTSPHLKDYRERIKINGQDIPEHCVVEFIERHRSFFESNSLSFFEMTFGLATDYFNDQKVDIAIIEVGMGGRLDSTNIITPLISVITNIGLDHTQFLGETHPLIAAEKAGIIKQGVPVVIGEYLPETLPVFLAKANECDAPVFLASDLVSETYPSVLQGDYQVHNIRTVMQTIEVLRSQQLFEISDKQLREGLLNVIENTNFRGRWQVLGQNPMVICDTAHNAEGLTVVLRQLQKLNFEQLHIVLGFVNDKDLNQILQLFPKKALYYFCKPNIPRGLEAALLAKQAVVVGINGTIYGTVSEAYIAALANAKPTDLVFVGGSTFVVAEIL